MTESSVSETLHTLEIGVQPSMDMVEVFTQEAETVVAMFFTTGDTPVLHNIFSRWRVLFARILGPSEGEAQP
jgi:hypothetical protein